MNLCCSAPLIGLSGHKKTGKTTLLEKLIPALCKKGLTVAYLKYDSCRIDMDSPGKDTDRAFKAGAAWVGIVSEFETAVRGFSEHLSRARLLTLAGEICDIVIVEGGKTADWPKLWMREESGVSDSASFPKVIAEISPSENDPTAVSRDDVDAILELVLKEARSQVLARPVCGGLLIGGTSERMGSPKALLSFEGRPLAEHVWKQINSVVSDVYLLGSGPRPESMKDKPCLPDSPGLNGPIAGMVSAFKHREDADWLFLAVDLPNVTPDYLKQILSRRDVGYRAAVPLNPEGYKEPLCALYSPSLGRRIVRLASPQRLSLQELLSALGVTGDPLLWNADKLFNWNEPG
ncbi:MAG: molybdopterin-guanine dinucleotide biosynthesis protein B [Candidatus Eiseniibacteriota bacterium]|nr:MAG: molybdopterin-guanine dinucleotide biosynthesis protein B [Candidatus Eisenbacteria bacterium]